MSVCEISTTKAKVALVSMPFASTQYSSMALSVLAPIVEELGHEVTIYYYNLRFAAMVGVDFYEELAADQVFNLGEQSFSEVRFPGRCSQPAVREYLDRIVPRSFFSNLCARADELVECAAQEVMEGGYDVIGFTTTFYQKMAALAVAKRLRDKGSSAAIVLGGAACESPMGEALLRSFSEVDAVFHGDAERSFPLFLQQFAGGTGSEMEGVSYRDATGAIVALSPTAEIREELVSPLPRYDEYLDQLQKTGLKSQIDWCLSYETSRGCWWGEKSHCTFCGLNGMQMTHRVKTRRSVVSDLKKIRNKYGPSLIHFSDNIIHFSAFSDLLPELENIDGQKYFAEVKSNLRESDFIAMARAGMTRIQPGIERLSDEPLRLMRKGTSALHNIQSIKMAAEFGIRPYWNVLIGFPGEKVEDVVAEAAMMLKLSHLPPPEGCSFIRLDRFSPNHTYPEKFGIRRLAPSEAERMLFFGVEEIDNLAYHFEYELMEQPSASLREAWTCLRDVVDRWISAPKFGMLVVYEDGQDLVIQDSRAEPLASEIVLSGQVAAIYRECFVATPVNLLRAYSEAEEVIEELESLGVLLVDSGRALAIAIRDKEMIAKAHSSFELQRRGNFQTLSGDFSDPLRPLTV